MKDRAGQVLRGWILGYWLLSGLDISRLAIVYFGNPPRRSGHYAGETLRFYTDLQRPSCRCGLRRPGRRE